QCDKMLEQFASFDVRRSQCGVAAERPKLHCQIARLFDEIDDPLISVAIEVFQEDTDTEDSLTPLLETEKESEELTSPRAQYSSAYKLSL
ncbi:Gstm5, partial [Symbiodinium pilosum]